MPPQANFQPEALEQPGVLSQIGNRVGNFISDQGANLRQLGSHAIEAVADRSMTIGAIVGATAATAGGVGVSLLEAAPVGAQSPDTPTNVLKVDNPDLFIVGPQIDGELVPGRDVRVSTFVAPVGAKQSVNFSSQLEHKDRLLQVATNKNPKAMKPSTVNGLPKLSFPTINPGDKGRTGYYTLHLPNRAKKFIGHKVCLTVKNQADILSNATSPAGLYVDEFKFCEKITSSRHAYHPKHRSSID